MIGAFLVLVFIEDKGRGRPKKERWEKSRVFFFGALHRRKTTPISKLPYRMEPPSSHACFTWAFFRASREITSGTSKRPRQFGQPTHLPDQCPPSCTEVRRRLLCRPFLSQSICFFLELSYPPQNTQPGGN